MAFSTSEVREMEREIMEAQFGPRPPVRTFTTGATRDGDNDKYDYEGFLSPLVLERFGAYMHKHRVQSNGTLRASDNWQKGIPPAEYMKSMWRHFMDLWRAHRSSGPPASNMEEALCGVMFNAMGYLHELLRSKDVGSLSQVRQ